MDSSSFLYVVKLVALVLKDSIPEDCAGISDQVLKQFVDDVKELGYRKDSREVATTGRR